MTDPTPTSAEVDSFRPVDIHERNADMLAEPDGQWVRLSDYQALRERAEAAEAMAESLRKMEEEAADGEREYRRIAEKAADVMLRAVAERDEARRAEAAAWNDAIEAAAGEVESLWAFRTCQEVADAIRALRRAAPTEGEA